ncbi:hypothetical protein EDC04DRAFT_2910560 [Pisolithus marmoratus]|nr:hypothetical protein EDC04DRAFT_2910560 [Pisolithus marmoratus]
MSSDNARAQWNDNEKGALITFLLEEKCAGKMGDGAFKPAIMNAAAAHLLQLFPNQRGLMKTEEHCKRQMSSLKTVLRDINQWHSMSGVHWDNVNGVKVGTEEEKQVFKTWLQVWIALQIPCAILKTVGGPTLKAIAISDSTECGGVSTRSHVSSISGTPSSHIHPSYPNSSSHALSNPIVTPSISSVPFWFVAPWVGSPSGTISGSTSNDGFVEKPLNFVDVQPQALPLPHPLIPPPAPPAVFSSSTLPMTMGAMQSSKKCSLGGVATNSSTPLRDLLSVQVALQAISVEDDGEQSLKRAKKAAAQQIWTDKLQVALMTVEEQDKDLPIEAKAALIEAFHMLDAMLSLLPQTCT